MRPIKKLPVPPSNRAKEITFKVSRPDGQYGLHKIADTTFSLGKGPCGRWVQRLEVDLTDALLVIRQHSVAFDITEVACENSESNRVLAECSGRYPWQRPDALDAALKEFHLERLNRTREILRKAHDDYEIKEFVYKIADIHGRITITK